MKYKVIIIILVSSLCLCQKVKADSYLEDDFLLWTQLHVNFPLKGKLKGYLFTTPRFADNVTDISQFVLRPAIYYKLTDKLSIWQGYDWVPFLSPKFRNENRIFQGILHEHNVSRLKLAERFRVEERFLADSGSPIVRGRIRLKAMLPLGKKKNWGISVFDEIFINFNSSSNGPNAGFDQNRFFAGVYRNLTKRASIETGYQLFYFNHTRPRVDTLGHTLLANIYYNFN